MMYSYLGQATYMSASVTKQYNLVLAKGGGLLGWESNHRPGGKYRQPTTGFMTKSPAG